MLRDALVASLDADVAVDEDALRAQYEKAPLRFMAPQLRLRRAVFPTAASTPRPARRSVLSLWTS